MCTVTYVPSKDGFCLTSNRDEAPSRNSVEWPSEIIRDDKRIIFPRDTRGNGSWIAVDNRNNAVCLLNGAFQRHERKERYRHSRGIVVLDSITYKSAEDFNESYDLDEIEPFTLVMITNGQLYEFKWDGVKKYLRKADNEMTHIWSSVTLYDPETVRKREAWFADWLGKTEIQDRNNLLSFHRSEGLGDPSINIKMKREYVQTLSITSVVKSGISMSVFYQDLITGFSSEIEL